MRDFFRFIRVRCLPVAGVVLALGSCSSQSNEANEVKKPVSGKICYRQQFINPCQCNYKGTRAANGRCINLHLVSCIDADYPRSQYYAQVCERLMGK